MNQEENEIVVLTPYEVEFFQVFMEDSPINYTPQCWKLTKKYYSEFKEIVKKEFLETGLFAKWLYRLEYKDETNGLWYNGAGEWCFQKGIGALGDECKTKNLPMKFDWRYRQDGRKWFSSCSEILDLLHWFSVDDARQLIANGFVFTRYLAADFHEYENETVFLKETCLKREEIDFFELFNK